MSVLARLWRFRHRRPRTVALSVVVLAFFLAYPLFDWYLRGAKVAGTPGFARVTPFTFNDFGAFGTAVDNWYAGDPIYTETNGSYRGGYLYPPAYVLLFVPFYEAQFVDVVSRLPFADFGFEAGAITWGLFALGVLWVGLQLVVDELGYRLAPYERVGLLWLLVGFQPVLFSFKWGQTAAFQAGLLCLAFVGLRGRGVDGGRTARIVSGALTTLASAMKPFYATSGAHLLRNRDRLLGAFAGICGLVGLSLVVGVDELVRYWDVLTWGKGWGGELRPPWQWGPTYYRPLYAVESFSTELGLLVRAGAVAAIVALALRARSAPAGRETFAMGVAAIPLLAPTAYTYDLGALLVVVVVLIAVELDREGYPWLPVLAVWLLGSQAYGLKYLVDHLPAFVPAREWVIHNLVPVLQPGLWGNLILLGLAAHRVRDLRGRTAARPGEPSGTDSGSTPR
jgi:alpha-1,2-mannosyltransferase